MTTDRRNVGDEFKDMSVEDIKMILDTRRHSLQIAVENLERDFNMGTIVRNANAFNASAVHVIGRRQWNKRGAMATDLYMNVQYHSTIDDFLKATKDMQIIGFDNTEGSVLLGSTTLPKESVLVFGSESSGLSEVMINSCDKIVAIEQFGSTRSINVGVASGIAMYSWVQQHALS